MRIEDGVEYWIGKIENEKSQQHNSLIFSSVKKTIIIVFNMIINSEKKNKKKKERRVWRSSLCNQFSDRIKDEKKYSRILYPSMVHDEMMSKSNMWMSGMYSSIWILLDLQHFFILLEIIDKNTYDMRPPRKATGLPPISLIFRWHESNRPEVVVGAVGPIICAGDRSILTRLFKPSIFVSVSVLMFIACLSIFFVLW